ncbi:MAG: serine-threonine kinase [Parachlamydiales bacterium]|nr:serine-threonine kinase [Parachlamydiales bacterium]
MSIPEGLLLRPAFSRKGWVNKLYRELNDRRIFLEFVQSHGLSAIEFIGSKLLTDDPDILLRIADENTMDPNSYNILNYASNALKKLPIDIARYIIMNMILEFPETLEYADSVLRNLPAEITREIVLVAVQENGLTLRYASPEFQNNREIVMAAVQQNGLAILFASDALKGDEIIARAAEQQNSQPIDFVNLNLRKMV